MINAVLRASRKAAGMTLDQVSKSFEKRGVQIRPNTVAQWENGRRQPGINEFLILCELYDIKDILHSFTGENSIFSGLNDEGIREVWRYVDYLMKQPFFTETNIEPLPRSRAYCGCTTWRFP